MHTKLKAKTGTKVISGHVKRRYIYNYCLKMGLIVLIISIRLVVLYHLR